MSDKHTKTISKKSASVVAMKRVVETDELRQQRIAQRAYERFAARGYVDGHDVEDWLAAESEI